MKKGTARTLAALFITIGSQQQPALASDGKILNEVWGMVNEYFIDTTYNGNDWKKVQKDYSEKVLSGGDETKLTQKMLGNSATT
jgi:hypothetical protein